MPQNTIWETHGHLRFGPNDHNYGGFTREDTLGVTRPQIALSLDSVSVFDPCLIHRPVRDTLVIARSKGQTYVKRCLVLSHSHGFHLCPLVAFISTLCGSSLATGCSQAPANISRRDSQEVRNSRAVGGNDSLSIVSTAVAVLNGPSKQRRYDVVGFVRSDSGYLVRLELARSADANVRTVGGGGLVFVGLSGKARLVELYR